MKKLLGIILFCAIGLSLQAKTVSKPKSNNDMKFISSQSKANPSLAEKQDVPREINYQGWLGNASDTTALTGNYNMVFSIYDSATEGTQLWTETQNSVNVNRGIFNVLLGSLTPIPVNIFDGKALYIDVWIGGEFLSPRKKIISVGYSIKAEVCKYADTANYVAGANIDGKVAEAVRADTATYANTDDAYPIVDGDFIFIDIDARSGNTIGAGNFTADKMYGQVFEFVDAGTLDLTDTTIDVTKIRVKLLYFVSGVGSRYGRAFGQIIIPNLSA
jgi:hypothetical protein